MDKASEVHAVQSFDQFQAKVLKFESVSSEFRQPIPTNALFVLLSTIAVAADVLDKIKKAGFYGKEIDPLTIDTGLGQLRTMLIQTRTMSYTRGAAMRVEAFPIGDNDLDSMRKFHALLGMITETGEIAQELVDACAQNRKLDTVNVLEEIGDNHWYEAVFYDTSGHCLLDSLNVVDRKLAKRYGDAYNDQGALHRDTAVERKAMETELKPPAGYTAEELDKDNPHNQWLNGPK